MRRSQRDTRMRVNRREPQDQDEQREFHEILEQFKRGIDQNLDSEDYQAHYDLGVAFKEMGLLDEAIGEFQKALRAPEGTAAHLRGAGHGLLREGTVRRLRIGAQAGGGEHLAGSDEAKIGLLYWMGRASEALGKEADAIASYERAMVVDIRFMDLSQRMQRLTRGTAPMSSQTAPITLADLQRGSGRGWSRCSRSSGASWRPISV